MSKVGKKNKGKSQEAHAQRRASNRLGLELNDNDLRMISKDIQEGRCVCVEKQSNRVSKFKMKVKDIETIVVYDSMRKTIVSFLEVNPDPFLDKFFNYQKFE